MEIHHSSALTHWIEAWFHVHPPDHLVMAVFAAVVLSAFAIFFRRRISVESPGKLQLLLEGLVGGLLSLLRALQTETGTAFAGNLSWIPYVISVVALAVLITALVREINKRSL